MAHRTTLQKIMAKWKVLVTRSDIPEVGLDLLRSRCDVTIVRKEEPSQDDIIKAIPGHDAVFVIGHVFINSEVLNAAGSRLKAISTMSAGYEHLDISEIKRRGIEVGHTPVVVNAPVAEVAILLLLNAARRAHEGRTLLEADKWSSSTNWLLGQDLRESTVGIVGLGNIGVEIVKRLIPFGVQHFLYTGHSRKKIGDDLGAEFVSLDKLLERSDFVVVATPLTDETRGLFNDAEFDKMKKTAVFVNIGRGAVVKTDALLRALKQKKIFAAGVDVIDPEPFPGDHEILKLPNFEILPHLGTATVKSRDDMANVAAQNILNVLDGKSMVYPL